MKNRFFDVAKAASKHSDHPAHKLGAVIVKGNKIISVGFNKNKTHTKSNHAWKGFTLKFAQSLRLNKI
jgi:deoxycytidylate deaminase